MLFLWAEQASWLMTVAFHRQEQCKLGAACWNPLAGEQNELSHLLFIPFSFPRGKHNHGITASQPRTLRLSLELPGVKPPCSSCTELRQSLQDLPTGVWMMVAWDGHRFVPSRASLLPGYFTQEKPKALQLLAVHICILETKALQSALISQKWVRWKCGRPVTHLVVDWAIWDEEKASASRKWSTFPTLSFLCP